MFDIMHVCAYWRNSSAINFNRAQLQYILLVRNVQLVTLITGDWE